MARYQANNDLAGTKQAMSTSYKTLLTLTGVTASLCSAKIFDIMVGTNGTPADNSLEIDVSRVTAVGTATSLTANPLDPTHRAAGCLASGNHTSEPTVTAASSLHYYGMNQRASYRWVAAPGSELIVPNTNAAGICLRAKSAQSYTGTATGEIMFEE